MRYSKKELLRAFYLLLDEELPKMNCKKIDKHGNYICEDRCDECMLKQYIERIKNGEKPKITEVRSDI